MGLSKLHVLGTGIDFYLPSGAEFSFDFSPAYVGRTMKSLEEIVESELGNGSDMC